MSSKDESLAMYNAIFEEDYGKIRDILRQGCSPDIIVKESTRLCGLTLATVHKQTKIVKVLIRYGASLSLRDIHGKTAVMYACLYTNEEILSLLVTAGADLSVADNDGRTALHFAAQAGCLDCLKVLLKYNVDVNRVDVNEKSAVMLAACGNNPDLSCLEFLVRHKGVDIDRVDRFGNSPLIAALHHCKTLNGKVLLDNEAKVNVKNLEGKTALSMAFEQTRNVEMLEMVETLLSHGAQPNFSLCDELSLHEMIARGKTKIVQLMIVNGCTPHLRHCKENAFKFDITEKLSPLAVAVLSNQLAIAKYLFANLFLTTFDVTNLSNSPEIRSHLSKMKFHQCSSLMKDFAMSPSPLFLLSFIAVSELAFNNYRSQSQQCILAQLPNLLQTKLLFSTQMASLCIQEWESFPLMFVAGNTFQLTHPINTAWPAGHKLTMCPCTRCSKSKNTGYRLLRHREHDDL